MEIEKSIVQIERGSQAWFDKFKSALNSWGFESSKCDNSLFFKRVKYKIIILLLYVDDITTTSNNSKAIEEVQAT